MADNNALTIENAQYEVLLKSKTAEALAEKLHLTDAQLVKANTSLLTLLTDEKLRGASQVSKLRFAYQTATFNYAHPNAIAPINYGGNIQAQLQYQAYIEDVLACGGVDEINAVALYKGIEYKAFINQWGYKELVLPERVELTDIFEEKEVIGYYAYAKCKDGRVVTSLLSNDQIKTHATKYSKSYKSGTGVWVDSYDKMARKTVIKAVARIVLQMYPFDRLARSLQIDQAVFTDRGIEYLDNPRVNADGVIDQKPTNNLSISEEEKGN